MDHLDCCAIFLDRWNDCLHFLYVNLPDYEHYQTLGWFDYVDSSISLVNDLEMIGVQFEPLFIDAFEVLLWI